MTDTQAVVGRRVACAEARAAERGLHDSSRCHQVSHRAVLYQFHEDRGAGRVNAQRKLIRSDGASFQNISRRAEVLEAAAGTSGDDSLLYVQLSVMYFIFQCKFHLTVQTDERFLLAVIQYVHQVSVHLLDSVGIARMERHGDHRADSTEINLDHAVVVSHVGRSQLLIILLSSVNLIELADGLVGLPDGGKTGGLCGHDIHANTEIRA